MANNQRRHFLFNTAGLAGLSFVHHGCTSGGMPNASGEQEGASITAENPGFLHGVASGDPYPDSVLLWTRYTPDQQAQTVQGVWEIALDKEFTKSRFSGGFRTDKARDYTVKVVANGLNPGTTYYFRFHVGQQRSVIGRTRTAAVGVGRGKLRFAATSCAAYDRGYFNVYRQISALEDLDAHICLGDYIYENPERSAHPDRTLEPRNELISLQDYRTRYALYRRDVDLQACHQQHPVIAVWDDHEIADNANRLGAADHQPDTDGDWEQRKAAAIQAYFEWMPVRDEFNPLTSPDAYLYRQFSYGDLLEIYMLETRLESRDPQARTHAEAESADRKLISDDQESWLFSGLIDSNALWKVVGQQTLFSQLRFDFGRGPETFNFDAWDGYVNQRERFFSLIKGEAVLPSDIGQPAFPPGAGLDNVVVLAGDLHVAGAADVTDDLDSYDQESGAGAFAVEFVAPAAASTPGTIPDDLSGHNPHLRYARGNLRGYCLLDINASRCQAEWYFSDSIHTRSSAVVEGEVWRANTFQSRLERGTRSIPDPDAPELA